jgi:hypothetical protein
MQPGNLADHLLVISYCTCLSARLIAQPLVPLLTGLANALLTGLANAQHAVHLTTLPTAYLHQVLYLASS